MTVITVNKSSSGLTKETHSIFDDENPDITSYSNLILLNDYYKHKDVDYITKNLELMRYLKLRDIFLKEEKSKTGDLVCHYCGKKHLKIGYISIGLAELNKKNPKLATIDHKIKRADCGDILDTNNWLVACQTCNGWKSDKTYDEFIAIMKERNKKTFTKRKKQHKKK
jgi:hypothetical protein